MAYMMEQGDWSEGGGWGPEVTDSDGFGSKYAGGATVYTRIRRWLVSTPSPIGSRIRAAEIADALGVSNTPVREALIRLSTEGLIENRRGSGFFIPIPRFEEAVALFEACHLIVEGALTQLYCRGMISRPIDEWRNFAYSKQPRYPPEVARVCVAFNKAVVAATDNDILSETLGNVEDRLFPLRVIDAETPDVAARQLSAVEDIGAAMRDQHGDAAITRLAKHHAELVSRVSYLVERRILSGLPSQDESRLSSI